MVLPSFARDERDRRHLLPQERVRLQHGGLLVAGHRLRRASSPGATTCSSPGQSTFDSGAFAIISMLVGVFTAIKVFNWVGTMYKGSIAVKTPFVYLCGFLYFTVFGGMTGIARGHGVAGRPLARHLLRRRPLPLHHGGHRHHRVPGGAALLDPQDVRAHVPRGLGHHRRRLHHLRLQRHLHPPVLAGQRRPAPPLLHVRRHLLGAERRLDRRRHPAGAGLHHDLPQPGLRPEERAPSPATTPGAPAAWSGGPPRRRPSTTSTSRRSSTRTPTRTRRRARRWSMWSSDRRR